MLLLFLSTATAMYCQQIQVSGTVLSAEDNFPIAGATVLVKGQNTGTTTDFDGNYQIVVNSGDVLIFSYLGFENKTVNILKNSFINIVLSPENNVLDEVVVVGYGSLNKKEVTGAVAVVNSKAIERLNPTKVEQALQGQVSGVNITSASGSPGSNSNIRIRGISTNGDNRPLILVDGNVIEDLSVINPNDIKSVNVLKDATAGIYGVRAANGVILIETKSGQKNRELKLQVDSYLGYQETSKKISVLDPLNYAFMVNQGLIAGGRNPEYENYPTTGTDWQDEVFSVAPIKNTNISADGGFEKTAYSFGVSYLEQQGIVGLEKSQFDRLTARMNLQFDLTENLKLSTTAIYTHKNKNHLNENSNNSVLFSAINMNPVMSVIDNNNTPNSGGYTVADKLGGEIVNPVAQIENTYHRENVDKISATLGLDYTIFKNFTASSKFQINHAYVYNNIFRPRIHYGSTKSLTVITSELHQNEDYYDDWTWDNYITYKNTFDEKHNLNVLLGLSAFKTTGEFTGMTGRNLTYNTLDKATMESAETTTNRIKADALERGSNTFDSRLLSYFTRIQYNYQGKYLFSGVVRRDGSTRFSPDKRFGYFPSASLGWVVTDEDFFENSTWFNSLKLRASYGIIGNDRIRDYGYVSLLGGEAVIANNTETKLTGDDALTRGLAEGVIANTEIRWEKQKTMNIGFDTQFLDNSVSISVDAFNKRTEDLLIYAEVAGVTGASAPGSAAPAINAGTVENKGIEFQISYNKNLSQDFKINTSFNISTIENNVVAVSTEGLQGGSWGVGIGAVPSRMDVGQPIGYFYGFKTAGVFKDQADVDNSPIITKAEVHHQDVLQTKPGDLKFVDISGKEGGPDGVITDLDKTYIGDPIADMTMGFNLGWSYKNIDFSSAVFASIGNEMIRNYERSIIHANKGEYVMDRWMKEGDISNNPRITSSATVNNNYLSDFYVEDASYIRIKNVQIGYNFKEFSKRIDADKMRVYVSVNNLHTFTKYKGYDPSASAGSPLGAGIDQGFYPIARTYLLGFNFKF